MVFWHWLNNRSGAVGITRDNGKTRDIVQHSLALQTSICCFDSVQWKAAPVRCRVQGAGCFPLAPARYPILSWMCFWHLRCSVFLHLEMVSCTDLAHEATEKQSSGRISWTTVIARTSHWWERTVFSPFTCIRLDWIHCIVQVWFNKCFSVPKIIFNRKRVLCFFCEKGNWGDLDVAHKDVAGSLKLRVYKKHKAETHRLETGRKGSLFHSSSLKKQLGC